MKNKDALVRSLDLRYDNKVVYTQGIVQNKTNATSISANSHDQCFQDINLSRHPLETRHCPQKWCRRGNCALYLRIHGRTVHFRFHLKEWDHSCALQKRLRS